MYIIYSVNIFYYLYEYQKLFKLINFLHFLISLYCNYIIETVSHKGFYTTVIVRKSSNNIFLSVLNQFFFFMTTKYNY